MQGLYLHTLITGHKIGKIYRHSFFNASVKRIQNPTVIKVVIHVEMPKAAPKSPFVI